MTDTKLRPEDLNAEERATVTQMAAMIYAMNPHLSAEKCFNNAAQYWSELRDFGRALFAPAPVERSTDPNCGPYTHHWNFGFCHTCNKPGRDQGDAPAPEKVAKVECWHCKQRVSHQLDHWASDGIGANGSYTCQPAPPEPAKVECPNSFPVGNCPTCGELVSPYNKHAKYEGGYTCQPAPPEPTAPVVVEPTDRPMDFNRSPFAPAATVEMPDEVDRACDLLEWSGNVNAAAALRDAWRTLAQPVDCQHCLKLIDERDLREEQIGRAAAALGMEDEWTSACDVGEALIERCEEISAAANSVLIQQAAQGRKVGDTGPLLKLAKDRYDILIRSGAHEASTATAWRLAIDAAEGKGANT